MKKSLFLFTLMACAPLHAMPEVWRGMKVPPAPVLTPEQALKSFKLAPGFQIEIAAADPLVHDPVAMVFDAAGRMWVVEMRAYMPNVDGKGEDARTGRIAVLEDTNGDGRMDKRTDFLTGLQMPRAIALVKGGVLVAEPPNLLFCEDTNGDLKCDRKTVALKGYARQGPVEHTENGLLPGLDNWLYNAKSTKRLRFIDGRWVVRNTVFRGQWGLAQDNYGRLYHNSNSAPLFVDLIPGFYTTRNPHHGTRAGLGQRLWGSSAVWTSRVNPGINRGYQKHMLRDGRLAVWTGASGPVIYRGDQFPAAMVGDAFIPEPCGNMIRRQRITWQDGRPRGDNAYDKVEWLTSTDERFRPVNMANGPDGCLYVIDMYRGIIQHRIYVTPFLRKQIIERKLDTPIGLGRIYRVFYKGNPRRKPTKVEGDLAKQLEHANGWTRSTAQRLIVQGGDRAFAPALRHIVTASPGHLARQHALWTLEGLNTLDPATLVKALTDEHPRVRIAALRTSEAWLAAATANDEEDRLILLQSVFSLQKDNDPDVRRQFALTLSALRQPGVEAVLRAFVLEHGSDAIIRDALLTGMAGRELEFLQRAALDNDWQGGIARDINRRLAGCVARERNHQRLGRLLRLAASRSGEFRHDLVNGIVTGAFPRGRPLKSVSFKNEPLPMAVLRDDAALKKPLERLSKFLVWGEAAKPPVPPRVLTASEQRFYAQGKQLYTLTCAACHHASGLGEEGKAPPLIDSQFLIGPADRAIAIVLHGVTGPITVQGRTYNMNMPALQGFNDSQVAAILTYARREWEHRADPITSADVARVKKTHANRATPWTEKELLQMR